MAGLDGALYKKIQALPGLIGGNAIRELQATVVDGGVITTGHEVLNVFHAGADLTSAIGEVTDITDPAGSGGWTDILDLADGPYLLQLMSTSSVGVKVHSTEDVGDSLAMEILADGNAIFRCHAVGDGVGVPYVYPSGPLADSSLLTPFTVKESLKVRAARVGTFTSTSSYVKFYANYWKV